MKPELRTPVGSEHDQLPGAEPAPLRRGAVKLRGVVLAVCGALLLGTMALVFRGIVDDPGPAAGGSAALAAAAGPGAGQGAGNGASSPQSSPTAPASAAALVERGAYLARVGNCAGCHTARGGREYVGGRPVPTPFGTIYSTNLTPDRKSGIGQWSRDDFWHALHNGKSRDGKLLYPAFPYPDYTRVSRADADALFAYLQSLEPVDQSNLADELSFPFNQRWLLAIWRGLFFRAGVFQPDPARGQEWNRGAYLVQGLGHCGACHTPRNLMGAAVQGSALAGATIPVLDWYAPALDQALLASYPADGWVGLMKHGASQAGVAIGPMSEVVRNSLQYMTESDLRAVSSYLVSRGAGTATGTGATALSKTDAASTRPAPPPVNPAAFERGSKLYATHCSDCHQSDGMGQPPAYPRLANTPSLSRDPPTNSIRIILSGGFAPSTAGNPRPYGMPPFAATLDDQQVADLVSYVRQAWGNRGGATEAFEVNRLRSLAPN